MKKIISACLLILSLAITQASSGEKREHFLTETGNVLKGFARSLVFKTPTPSGKIIDPMFPLQDIYDVCVKHPGKALIGASTVAFFSVYQGVAPVVIGATSAISSGKDFVRSFKSKEFSGHEKAFYSSIALLYMVSNAYGAVEGIQTYCSGEECSSVGAVEGAQTYCSGEECSSVNPCPLPEGSFRDSCNGTSILHISSDPNVGWFCKYIAYCLTDTPDKPVKNQFFYPAGRTPLQGLDNNNGIISSGSSNALDSQAVQTPNDNYCKNLRGSFFKTCRVTTENYGSSDPVVQQLGLPLCQVGSSCFDVDGEEVVHSQVILNEQRIGLPVENCNGYPVQHSGGQDNICQNADGSIAKRIGKMFNIGKVLGRTKLLPSD